MAVPVVATVQRIAERPDMALNSTVEQQILESDLKVEKRFSESLDQSINRKGGQFSEFRFVAVHLNKQSEICGGDDYPLLKQRLIAEFNKDYLAGLISIIGQ